MPTPQVYAHKRLSESISSPVIVLLLMEVISLGEKRWWAQVFSSWFHFISPRSTNPIQRLPSLSSPTALTGVGVSVSVTEVPHVHNSVCKRFGESRLMPPVSVPSQMVSPSVNRQLMALQLMVTPPRSLVWRMNEKVSVSLLYTFSPFRVDTIRYPRSVCLISVI